MRRIVWILMGLGIAARCVRMALRFPLWPDEAFLAASLIDRGYTGLLEPLEYHQVAPFLFMWVQVTFVKLLGFNEFALRMFPFLCGIGSLFLFRRLAARLLGGGAYVGAVALFAAAYPLIRYSGEAKPYSSDVLVALVLITLAVEAWRRPDRWLPMAALIAFVPVGIGLSYPAVFVGGGVSLALGAAALSRGDRRAWLRWCLYNLVLVGSFAGLFALSAGKQAHAETYMTEAWAHTFPPYQSPVELVGWLVKTHASDMLAYPVGASHGGSSLTLLGCIAGACVLLRQRRWTLALLCFVPPGLHLIAAAMQRYPYGGHLRFTLYLAPVICVLAALGVAWAIARFARSPSRRPALYGILLGLVALIPLGSMVRDVVRPYKRAEYQRACAFARWFWHDKPLTGEIVCMKTDLGLDFSPKTWAWGTSSLYLCNQRIYSERRARGEPPDFERVSKEWPLRVVQFRVPRWEYDKEAFDRWMARMLTKYDFVGHETHPMPDHGRRRTLLLNHIDVYEFVPK